MRDLSATMFYKAKFDLTAKNPDECDLLWKLVMNIRGWITGKLNRYGHVIVEADIKRWTAFKMGGKLYDLENTNRFFAESLHHVSQEDPTNISWACMIVEKPEPTAGYAPRSWTTEIGFQTTGRGKAEVSYVVTYSDAPGFIGPCLDMPSITVPNVIRKLLSDQALVCTIGNNVLTATPQRLRVGDYPKLEKVSTAGVARFVYQPKAVFYGRRQRTIVGVPPKSSRNSSWQRIGLFCRRVGFLKRNALSWEL